MKKLVVSPRKFIYKGRKFQEQSNRIRKAYKPSSPHHSHTTEPFISQENQKLAGIPLR
jgi:hypothetical protein